ncbi:MAG: alkaline phosphatase family protein [Verrucomicrobiae bacterium]|nr:alkaline phosphatase family protein [Verrucomicrobiae bacterium]
MSPLIDEGKMPFARHLIENGVMGNLATINPILSPMLWTSIATGKRPFKHGIHGFSEPDPHGGGIRPITNLARKTKAVWNILNQEGLRTNVVGWWPSHPAEPVNGVMVSNHFQQAIGDLDKPWPMRPGTVHPPERAEEMAEWRLHPQELDGDMLRLFVPNAPEIDQKKDRRLYSCAKIIAECSGVHAVATHLMENTQWDFMAVYYDAIDHFGHGFMKYHPPKQDWVSQKDFDLYKNVIECGYRYHDQMLGRLMQLAGPETTIILMSDHGFHPDALRPHHIPNEPAGPAAEHRPFGIFAAMGPGVKEDDLVFGASILDVCPTILAHFDLPTGRDMDGAPLTSIFKDRPNVVYIESWDSIEGDHDPGLHPPDARLDPVEAQQAIDQLVALGYIEEPDADKEVAVKETVRELDYNLARAYADASHAHEAGAIFAKLWSSWPEESRFGVHLFQVQLALGQIEKARETFEQIKENKGRFSLEAAEEIKKLHGEILEHQRNDPSENSDQAAEGAEPKIDFSKVDEKTLAKLRKLRRRAGVNSHAFIYLEGLLLHAEGQFSKAVDTFQKAASTEPNNLQTLLQKLAESQLALRNFSDAEDSFNRVLEFDKVNPHARLGLARLHLHVGRNSEAAAEAFAAAGQMFHNPKAHFLGGIALNRLGEVERAVESLHTSITQNPVQPAAHRTLASIYHLQLGNLEKAKEHRKLGREAQKRLRSWARGEHPENRHEFRSSLRPTRGADTVDRSWEDIERVMLDFARNTDSSALPSIAKSVTIVSGLPRSGTSMTMQMLAAGGLPILADDHRPADISNPRGYLELEMAKGLSSQKGKYEWLLGARGKAVKLVAQLLPRLLFSIRDNETDSKAVDLHYRILLMYRPMDEVIASQQKMLQRLGKGKTPNEVGDQDVLAKTFQTQLNQVLNLLRGWSRQHSDRVAVLPVSYQAALDSPAEVSAEINRFLMGSLDESAMVAAIDPSLRNEGARIPRQRRRRN